MRERYHHHGWNLSDDDTPKPPECSPIDSAQRFPVLSTISRRSVVGGPTGVKSKIGWSPWLKKRTNPPSLFGLVLQVDAISFT